MAIRLHQIDGVQVVFGLQWDSLPGEKSEASELRAKVVENDAAYHVRFAGTDSAVYGFLPKDSVASGDGSGKGKNDKKAKRGNAYVSASVLLATHDNIEPEAIWIEIEGRTARMAVLEGGMPSPAGDFSGSVDELDDLLQTILNDSGLKYTYYGEGTKEFADQYTPLTLHDLIQGGDVEQAALKASSPGFGSLLKFLGLVAVCGAGFFGYSEYQKHVETQKLIQIQREQEAQSPKVKYEQALAAALPSTGIPAASAADFFLGSWRKQEIEVAGWKLSSVVCLADACTYNWVIKHGDNKSLTKALGDSLKYEYSTSGKDIKYAIPAEAPTAKIEYAKLPKFSDFMLDTGSVAQNLALIGATVTIEPPNNFAAEGINMVGITDPIKAGGLVITTKLALLKEIMAKMPDNVTFKRLEIKLDDGEPAFTLNGNYYVKN